MFYYHHLDTPNPVSQSLSVLLGLKIRKLRMDRNLSQEEFAGLVGVHRTYLGQIERAEKNITIKNLEKICVSLGIEPKELFNFSDIL
ncbi:MAG: helix-turn-helix transcriptional regulator [Bacilli bacterium]|jgi:transcriptional regulator with XRE-family HTH domain|nr:helix-turn-helix transcriptional regulator [Bacilli bacterium]HHU24033.1 helix-turn-helix transcriptional regulator [Acholeplasmataceae bacterium]